MELQLETVPSQPPYQDRREGGEPRPLCYLPDGRGRHRTANVPRDFAAYRGTAAAAATGAGVRRSMSCIQEQPTEGVRSNAREKMARSDPRAGVRVTRSAGSSQHLASALQEGRENANIDAGLGFIWRISDYMLAAVDIQRLTRDQPDCVLQPCSPIADEFNKD